MKKVLTIAILVAALLSFTTGAAFAQDTTPITGTVELVEVLPPDPITGDTVVVVTILDETTGTSQTVNLSLETAELLGLVTVDDTTGEVTVNEVTDPITIEPNDILPETGEEEETETEHPVGSKLGEFFGEMIGVEYDAIMDAHDDGVGFGVIAQALWFTNQIEDGGTDEFEALIEAKKNNNYEDIAEWDIWDGNPPENWGDVVTSLKKGEKLGPVMSGKEDDVAEDADTTKSNGKNNGKGNSSDTGAQDDTNNGKGNGKGNNGKGNNGDKGNGNGKGKP